MFDSDDEDGTSSESRAITSKPYPSNLRRVQTFRCLDNNRQTQFISNDSQNTSKSSLCCMIASELTTETGRTMYMTKKQENPCRDTFFHEDHPSFWRMANNISNVCKSMVLSDQKKSVEDNSHIRSDLICGFHSVPTLGPSSAIPEQEHNERLTSSDDYYQQQLDDQNYIRRMLAKSNESFFENENVDVNTRLPNEINNSFHEDKENFYRPVYVIRPQHHVFGCAEYEDDDPDEFFISSGVVRASCPNIYEVAAPMKLASNYHHQYWRSCIELEHSTMDDEAHNIKSYLTDNYELQVRHAKGKRKNSEISSTTATTSSTMSLLSFGPSAQLMNNHYQQNRFLTSDRPVHSALPPLQLPYHYKDVGNSAKSKAVSLILLPAGASTSTRKSACWRGQLKTGINKWNYSFNHSSYLVSNTIIHKCRSERNTYIYRHSRDSSVDYVL